MLAGDEACLRRLARNNEGCLGFSQAALPVVEPVTYSIEGLTARLVVGPSAADAARRGVIACLQVEDRTSDGLAANVLATGRLRLVGDGLAEMQIELLSESGTAPEG